MKVFVLAILGTVAALASSRNAYAADAEIEVSAVPFAGPYASLREAAEPVRCERINFGTTEDPAWVSERRIFADPHNDYRLPEPRAPFLDLRLTAVTCRPPPDTLRYEYDQYRVYARRLDGWWRSPPVTVNGFGPHSDSEIGVEWSRRNVIKDDHSDVVLEISSEHDEDVCSLQGSERTSVSFLTLIADSNEGPPQFFGPIPFATKLAHDPGVGNPNKSCRVFERQYRMKKIWHKDTLEVVGNLEWYSVNTIPDRGIIGLKRIRCRNARSEIGCYAKGPSSAGLYRFIPATP